MPKSDGPNLLQGTLDLLILHAVQRGTMRVSRRCMLRAFVTFKEAT